jgi:hypothetical protein
MPAPINRPLIWRAAVEMWLSHMANNYVETTLLVALKQNTGNIEETISYLTSLGYGSILGLYGQGSSNQVHIDVGSGLKQSNFIQVFYPTWNDKVMDISLADILTYLKNQKKEIVVQLDLFDENKNQPQG